jgi:hypothetical protein
MFLCDGYMYDCAGFSLRYSHAASMSDVSSKEYERSTQVVLQHFQNPKLGRSMQM